MWRVLILAELSSQALRSGAKIQKLCTAVNLDLLRRIDFDFAAPVLTAGCRASLSGLAASQVAWRKCDHANEERKWATLNANERTRTGQARTLAD